MLKTIKQIPNLSGKTVLVRVDFNVPIKRKKVLDDTRLLAHLPTIKYLVEKKAKIILLTHVGRPGGKVVASLRVDPIVEELGKLLKKKVKKLETGSWKLDDKKKLVVLKDIEKMKPGQVAMMENIRFSPDEKKDTGTLSQELANLADYFALDGFAVAHRDSASVSGIAKHIPAYAGLLLEKEIKGLSRVTQNPKGPFVVVLGGAKMETKIPVIKNLLPKADYILIGGGIVNTYLKAKGFKVGASLIDKEYEKEVLKYCKSKKVIKPVDVVVGDVKGKKYKVVKLNKILGDLS